MVAGLVRTSPDRFLRAMGWKKDGFYLQGGPAYAQPDGGDAELGFQEKMGIGASVSESFGVYGEVSAAKFDDVDTSYGLKVGVEYDLRANF